MAGDLDLTVPPDRECTFISWAQGQPPPRLDDIVIGLYAGGVTGRDIADHLEATIGAELSHETISNITDAAAEEVLA